ncbi:hypothetical protein Pd630_LPD09197 (plasmid) [Rhodococcus opacus PD630]|nr:hypothetical protein Pd630_LPD09197 [Rhodococcus opacus PD630]
MDGDSAIAPGVDEISVVLVGQVLRQRADAIVWVRVQRYPGEPGGVDLHLVDPSPGRRVHRR